MGDAERGQELATFAGPPCLRVTIDATAFPSPTFLSAIGERRRCSRLARKKSLIVTPQALLAGGAASGPGPA
jgi:hypothetical protein